MLYIKIEYEKPLHPNQSVTDSVGLDVNSQVFGNVASKTFKEDKNAQPVEPCRLDARDNEGFASHL